MKDINQLKNNILESLKEIIDPELYINIVDLGLVYEVSIEKNNINIIYTLTSPTCPIAGYIEKQMQEIVNFYLENNNLEYNLSFNLTFNPVWTIDMMTEEAKWEITGEIIF